MLAAQRVMAELKERGLVQWPGQPQESPPRLTGPAAAPRPTQPMPRPPNPACPLSNIPADYTSAFRGGTGLHPPMLEFGFEPPSVFLTAFQATSSSPSFFRPLHSSFLCAHHWPSGHPNDRLQSPLLLPLLLPAGAALHHPPGSRTSRDQGRQ